MLSCSKTQAGQATTLSKLFHKFDRRTTKMVDGKDFKINLNIVMGLMVAEGLRRTAWFHNELGSTKLSSDCGDMCDCVLEVATNLYHQEINDDPTSTIPHGIIVKIFHLYGELVELDAELRSLVRPRERTKLTDAMNTRIKLEPMKPSKNKPLRASPPRLN